MKIQGIELGQTLSNCYLLYGQENWIKDQIVSYLKEQTLPGEDLMNYTAFEGKEVNVEQIIDIGETMPFFAEYKLIVIKDSGLFKTGKKEETQRLGKWIEKLPHYVRIIFDEKEVDKRNSLYKHIHKTFKAIEVNELNPQSRYDILQKICKEKGLSIQPSILDYFIANMPPKMQHMLKELDKLSDYCAGQEVTKKAIDDVCVFSLEHRVFELLKKTSEKKGTEALSIYHQLIEQKESPIGILVLLARQYRMLLQVKYLVKSRTTTKEIAQTVGIPFFVAKELEVQSSKFSFKQLQEILNLCLKSDEMIKTGEMEMIKCIELLIIQCLYIQ